MTRATQHNANAAKSFVYDVSPRYANASNWSSDFEDRYTPAFRSPMTILDVGSGRTPTIPVIRRPNDCKYVGLDVSQSELERAPKGAYDDMFARDICQSIPELENKVDLVISWQVFEHVQPLSLAIANISTYLKPGGQLVAMLSGRNVHFAILNRMVPEPIGKLAMKHLLNRAPDSVFRAHYDSCTFSKLNSLFQGWSNVEIVPLFRGATYFSFFKPAALAYLKYEDWAQKNSKNDLATHYVVTATK